MLPPIIKDEASEVASAVATLIEIYLTNNQCIDISNSLKEMFCERPWFYTIERICNSGMSKPEETKLDRFLCESDLNATVANSLRIDGSTCGLYVVSLSPRSPKASLPRTLGRYSL